MKNIAFFAGSLMLASQMAFGVLPPDAQRAKEIASIEEHEECLKLHELDPGELSINPSEDGYTVETPNFTMKVHVIYTPDGKIGPAKYQLEFDVPQIKEIPVVEHETSQEVIIAQE
ncbi:MAG: hypothetical protein HY860_05345 [Chlamydiales bacterium]|nr:hypothetical protein [Chlamydiales bacterium]